MENHPEGHDQPISHSWISKKCNGIVFRSESEDNSTKILPPMAKKEEKRKTKSIS